MAALRLREGRQRFVHPEIGRIRDDQRGHLGHACSLPSRPGGKPLNTPAAAYEYDFRYGFRVRADGKPRQILPLPPATVLRERVILTTAPMAVPYRL
ncbi:hypothetical protein GCM10017557_39890 [Streptomyces aurantiacus]|uniref:Uncharacterized protein n=1 Tax=Streptomyces aurantiacus TaxID=47760 RepID=A0A7G1P5M3_9ACTN|nr:hypothetical protein GCM10017557_39890 [Streptomyces aurantiacus]